MFSRFISKISSFSLHNTQKSIYNFAERKCWNFFNTTIYRSIVKIIKQYTKKYRSDFGERISEISIFRSTKLSQMMQQLKNVVTRLV